MYKRILFFGAGSIIGPEYIKRIRSIEGVEIVVGVDCDPLASGFVVSDISVVIPRVDDKDFVSSFQKVIDDYKIDYVFPFVEIGHNAMQQVDANFGSDLISGELCKDKYDFYNKCKEVGICIPETYLLKDYNDQLSFPLYVKPRSGDGSKDNYKVENKNQLEGVKLLYEDRSDKFLVQEFLSGQHWAADVVVENDEVVCVVTRKSLDRVYRVEVIDNPAFVEYCKVVQKKLGIKKIFNIEVFEMSKDNFVVNEINARMGGNCITSCLAGCDIISYLITGKREYLQKPNQGIYTFGYERYRV
jgi:carbamoyl-phosphate synthase large subunit